MVEIQWWTGNKAKLDPYSLTSSIPYMIWNFPLLCTTQRPNSKRFGLVNFNPLKVGNLGEAASRNSSIETVQMVKKSEKNQYLAGHWIWNTGVGNILKYCTWTNECVTVVMSLIPMPLHEVKKEKSWNLNWMIQCYILNFDTCINWKRRKAWAFLQHTIPPPKLLSRSLTEVYYEDN